VNCKSSEASNYKDSSRAIDLSGQWDIIEKDGDIKTKGRLPGDVHSALLEAGIIEDPYYGDNETKVQWVSEKDWIFKRTFDVPSEFLEYEDIYLNVNGPDTICEFKINDSLVANTDDMFLRYRFDIKQYLKIGINTIEIAFTSPRKKAAELLDFYQDKFPGAAATDKGFNLLRKVQCHGGWDWGIKIPSCGITDEINIVATNIPRVEHIYTDYKLSEEKCDVVINVEVNAKTAGHQTLTIEFDNQKENIKYDFSPGMNIVKAEFIIKKPKLWWPAGYGSQSLYNLKVIAGSQQINKKIGFRKVEFITKDDAFGQSMLFRINNKDIFCKGANWIPCDAMVNRQTPQKFEHLLDSVVQANMNMLRVWGGGNYEKDIFYELCDEKGILVFQDMMFSCSLYPTDEKFLTNVKNEITYQAKRLKAHPCIVLWGGDNECLNYALSWFGGSEEKNKFNKTNWLKLNETRKQAYMVADGTRAYVPSSPGNGIDNYDEWDDYKRGDTHNWDVWHGGKPFDFYYTIQPRFISEFGFQSFPSMESISTFAPKEQWAPESDIMKIHQKNGNGNRNITNTFKVYFKEPKDFQSMVYLSQLQQALAIKTGSEYWRSIKPVCMGILYWQLNDNWPVCSWSSIEYNGNWKQLHYQAKRFFSPVISCVIKKDLIYNLYSISDLLTSIDAKIQLSFYDLKGRNIKNLRWQKNILPQSSLKIAELKESDLPCQANQCFAILTTNYKGSRHVETVLCTEPRNYVLPQANVSLAIKKNNDNFEIKLAADNPALYVNLETPGIKGIFSENSFTLVPGDEKIVTFKAENICNLEDFKKSLKITHLRQTFQ
jgi:beta-mannosidase